MPLKSKTGKATTSTTQVVSPSLAPPHFTPRLLSQLCFVAWLQPGDSFPRVGEVHFASADFLPASTPPTQVYGPHAFPHSCL
jgi:hypothetical protein